MVCIASSIILSRLAQEAAVLSRLAPGDATKLMSRQQSEQLRKQLQQQQEQQSREAKRKRAAAKRLKIVSRRLSDFSLVM